MEGKQPGNFGEKTGKYKRNIKEILNLKAMNFVRKREEKRENKRKKENITFTCF